MAELKVVWKYDLFAAIPLPLPASGGMPVKLTMPVGSHILHTNVIDGTPCMWAAVDPNAAYETRNFLLVATGEEVPTDRGYIYRGTIIKYEELLVRSLVWHLMEPVEVDEP